MPDLAGQAPTLGEHPLVPRHLRRGFRDGFLLWRHAATGLVARPQLVLAVLVLATVGFVAGNFADKSATTAKGALKPRGRSVAASRTFLAKWRQPYEKDPVAGFLGPAAFAFIVPLFDAAVTITPVALEHVPYFGEERDHAKSHPGHAFVSLCGFLAVTAVLFLPVFVGLLGWVRDARQPVRISAWARYLRESYWPMAKGMSVFFAVAFASLLAAALLSWAVAGLGRLVGRSVNAQDSFPLLAVAGVVPLILAPFAIVGRRLGTRQGIVEGWRLLRANWPAMIALFLLFRVGREVFAVWTALAPWPLTDDKGWLIVAPGSVAWSWLAHVGEALLGLWLAYAFMAIATEPSAALTEANPE